MLLAHRLRAIREAKNLSQGDIEERTGLLRPYISRVENGHTVPSIETLEKLARALEVPLLAESTIVLEIEQNPSKTDESHSCPCKRNHCIRVFR